VLARGDQGGHVRVVVSVLCLLRDYLGRLEHGVAHSILAVCVGILAVLRGPLGIPLGHAEKLGHLVLADTEGVVGDIEGLLEDHEVVLLVMLCRDCDALPAVAGEEVRAQGKRETPRQVGVAEDAIHLLGVVAVVGHVLVAAPRVGVLALDSEGGLPAIVLDESIPESHLVVVLPILICAHLADAPLELCESFGVVDGIPGEEVHLERTALGLAQLLEDGILAALEHLLELDLQKICVGLNGLGLLVALLLLEDLHEFALAWLREGGQQSRVLDALEECGVLAREGEREVGDVGHDCCVRRKEGVCLEEGGISRSNLLGLESQETKKVFFFLFWVCSFFFWFYV
jgi:hypothetical protein